MSRCPFTDEQIRAGLSASPESDVEYIDGDASLPAEVPTEVVNEYRSLLGAVQSVAVDRLPSMISAAPRDKFDVVELLDETSAQYVFSVSGQMWDELCADLELSEQRKVTLAAIHDPNALSTPRQKFIVEKPNGFRTGANTVLTEMSVLLASGMTLSDAVKYISVRNGLGNPLDPLSDASFTERAAAPEALQARAILHGSPSDIEL